MTVLALGLIVVGLSLVLGAVYSAAQVFAAWFVPDEEER